jgi:hypothetical protein
MILPNPPIGPEIPKTTPLLIERQKFELREKVRKFFSKEYRTIDLKDLQSEQFQRIASLVHSIRSNCAYDPIDVQNLANDLVKVQLHLEKNKSLNEFDYAKFQQTVTFHSRKIEVSAEAQEAIKAERRKENRMLAEKLGKLALNPKEAHDFMPSKTGQYLVGQVEDRLVVYTNRGHGVDEFGERPDGTFIRIGLHYESLKDLLNSEWISNLKPAD